MTTLRMLELSSGTGSVGNVARSLGWEVVSLDRDLPADIEVDIMEWNLEASTYPRNYFHFIWASPPCTEYSRAKTTGPPRQIEEANAIVSRTFEIIDYFDPIFWCVENPQTGLLKDQAIMQHKPFKDIDYCKYGKLYRKRTRLWNNIDNWIPRPLCKRDCNSMDSTGKKHKAVAQRFAPNYEEQRQSQHHLYSIPAELVEELLLAIHQRLD